MIYATHREMNGWRSAPSLDTDGKVKASAEHPLTRPRWSEGVDCDGRLVIDDDTMLDDIWVAVCDACGYEVGVPPRAQKAFEEELSHSG